MTHVAVISDAHLHNWEAFSRIDPETGLNSRLLDGLNALRQVRAYCSENEIFYVLNGGDLLHKGATVSVDLLELLIDELVEFREEGVEVISVVGQHDFLRRDGTRNLPRALDDLMTVLNEPGHFATLSDDMRVIGCPFRYGLKEQQAALMECGKNLGKKKNILLGHFLLREILEQNAAPFDKSEYISLEGLPKTSYILLGDYHYHVKLKGENVVSIGGLTQHTFGDKNRPQGGFLDFDLKTMTFERIEVDAPMFVEVDPDEKFPNQHNPRNFYKIRTNDQQREDKIRANLSGDWNCLFEPVIEEVEVDEEAPRLNVDLSMKPEQVIREYCSYLGVGEDYLKKGLEFLQ